MAPPPPPSPPPPPARLQARLGHTNDLSQLDKHLTQHEQANIRRVFFELDINEDSVIDAYELQHSMREDGIILPLRAVQGLIWEADEDLNGVLSLDEVMRMYLRAKNDSTGLEPRGLFNYVLYKVLDRDRDRSIQMDEMYTFLANLLPFPTVVRKMEYVFGRHLYTAPMAAVTAKQWLRILSSSLWSDSTPITDDDMLRRIAKDKRSHVSEVRHRIDCRLSKDLDKRLSHMYRRKTELIVPKVKPKAKKEKEKTPVSPRSAPPKPSHRAKRASEAPRETLALALSQESQLKPEGAAVSVPGPSPLAAKEELRLPIGPAQPAGASPKARSPARSASRRASASPTKGRKKSQIIQREESGQLFDFGGGPKADPRALWREQMLSKHGAAAPKKGVSAAEGSGSPTGAGGVTFKD
ncbi:unnamed protein product [Vitrella brassicaformis CCMP3155]|uniref:EF-hand domain-containing protein n=1 Tax=Vitrella brassicaformis (strain CCMP3155) TaxID=1169540 RepID=A0A0G4G6F1_VITBC|nr:unnamed protein product [Vitrella brassicaformis CCMP3155]|eukprot:CEM24107.1 unnamed protein product [Vitrella brassicaformis CCMP3155]